MIGFYNYGVVGVHIQILQSLKIAPKQKKKKKKKKNLMRLISVGTLKFET